jgi:hypothetical protein
MQTSSLALVTDFIRANRFACSSSRLLAFVRPHSISRLSNFFKTSRSFVRNIGGEKTLLARHTTWQCLLVAQRVIVNDSEITHLMQTYTALEASPSEANLGEAAPEACRCQFPAAVAHGTIRAWGNFFLALPLVTFESLQLRDTLTPLLNFKPVIAVMFRNADRFDGSRETKQMYEWEVY